MSPFCCCSGAEFGFVPGRPVRARHPGTPRQLEVQEDEDVVQAPPAQDDEVVLRHQPQPRCEGPQAAIPKNRTTQESSTGKCIKKQGAKFVRPTSRAFGPINQVAMFSSEN